MNKSKIKVANEIKHITYDDAINDLVILYENKNMSYINIKNKHYGNKLLDYYFFPYRLNTITKKHITFYEFYFKKLYDEHGNFKTFLKYAENKYKTYNFVNIVYDFFRLYYGSVSQFSPLIASSIYNMFKPTCIIDPCAGWGGRLLGAMVNDDIKYIGFDTNTNLKKPYKELINMLNVKDGSLF